MYPFSFQIQVSEARYTSVTQTLVKIGKEEGLYGYFKVMNVFASRKVLDRFLLHACLGSGRSKTQVMGHCFTNTGTTLNLY